MSEPDQWMQEHVRWHKQRAAADLRIWRTPSYAEWRARKVPRYAVWTYRVELVSVTC